MSLVWGGGSSSYSRPPWNTTSSPPCAVECGAAGQWSAGMQQMAWHGMEEHSMAWHGRAQHGRAWHWVAWHGRAWHGMAGLWHSMACRSCAMEGYKAHLMLRRQADGQRAKHARALLAVSVLLQASGAQKP